jgi:LemA protein
MGTAVWISIAVVVLLIVLLALYLWVTYNSLVTLRQRVDEAWSDIAAQLRRRADLIPNLTGMVSSYATHEKAVFGAVTVARDESLSASTPAEASVAENHMQQALRSVFSSAESFPQLQASPEFLQLQADLVDTEDRIQASRRFYNGGVREFNNKITVFPNSLFARRLGFGPREFFEAADIAAIAQPPRIQF